MEKPSASSMLERTTSIEEPKTLSEEELNEFRAAALKVIDTHGREEAEKIFMGGLKPVTVTTKPVGGSKRKHLWKKASS
ncbi:unnamed protein product [Ilex paraguariensis]|uniref:Uncharacterized protein n=1 Tax=Ilex paraguariensis TaxID=185542 RepID=A0ABC8QPT5_9AQUA